MAITTRPLTRMQRGMITLPVALLTLAGTASGCGASHHTAHAPSPVVPRTSAAIGSPPPTSNRTTATLGATHRSAAIAQTCRAISLNLTVVTRAATAPSNPSVDHVIAQLQHLRDNAPPEIKHDLQVIADFDQKTVAALRSGQSPDSIQETPKLTAALAHQARWSAQHCAP